MPTTATIYPPATPPAMAILTRLLEDCGVELRVSAGGELLIRDAGKRLTPDDRSMVHHYRHALADHLTAPTPTAPQSDTIRHPKKESKRQDGPTCDRCGGGEFHEVAIHGGASVRRDCARCRRTWGFPVWWGDSA